MPIRMTGIASGLDTESIIKELMNAHSLKRTQKENKITKHEWMQDKWKDLNSKIYSFYTGSLSKIRMQSSFQSKKATSSNETKVSVTASNNAVEGSHTLKVNQLATSQYVTSAKLTAQDAEGNSVAVTSATKLVGSLGLNMEEGLTIHLATEDKSIDFDVTEYSTVGDFVNACKSIGLNASFDTNQGRFFISSASSGAKGAFSITTSESSPSLWAAKKAVRDAIGYGEFNSNARAEIDKYIMTYATAEDEEVGDTAYTKLLEKLETYVTSSYAKDIKEKYNNNDSNLDTNLTQVLDTAKQKAISDYIASVGADKVTEEGQAKAVDSAISKAITDHVKEVRDQFTTSTDLTSLPDNPYVIGVNKFKDALEDYKTMLSTPSALTTEDAELDINKLGKMGLAEIVYEKGADGNLDYENTTGFDAWKALGGALVEATNSVVEYNGATLVNASNTFTANGLTFTVQDVTAQGETISLTVAKDTDGVYNMVKSFLKEYNALLDELTKAYNSPSTRGYNPLTDEERDSMTDDQIEKWETKIKDSLLRRDSTLNGVISALRDSLMGSVEHNGKTYSLSSFGITTKFYTEKGKLHIAGDSDDALTSGDADRLRSALQEDPDAVMNVLSKLAQGMYDTLTEKMRSTKMSSAFTIYNDKQMKTDLDSYKLDLKKLETKLSEMEDRYYKQFSMLEKSLSSLNSQSNQFTSMMGG